MVLLEENEPFIVMEWVDKPFSVQETRIGRWLLWPKKSLV
jgi:hypothetical protein